MSCISAYQALNAFGVTRTPLPPCTPHPTAGPALPLAAAGPGCAAPGRGQRTSQGCTLLCGECKRLRLRCSALGKHCRWETRLFSGLMKGREVCSSNLHACYCMRRFSLFLMMFFPPFPTPLREEAQSLLPSLCREDYGAEQSALVRVHSAASKTSVCHCKNPMLLRLN